MNFFAEHTRQRGRFGANNDATAFYKHIFYVILYLKTIDKNTYAYAHELYAYAIIISIWAKFWGTNRGGEGWQCNTMHKMLKILVLNKHNNTHI